MTTHSNEQLSVGIIGAGWVGEALAQMLKKLKFNILASRQSEDGLQVLANSGIPNIKLSVQADSILEHDNLIFKQQCLIICIPPGIRYGKGDYPQKIKQIVDAASSENSKVTSLILLSSTAVYNGLQGEVNELTKLDYSAEKVELLATAEQYVLNSKLAHKYVIRLAGLIGYYRQPGRFFAQGRAIPNPDSVVNFIHRDDVLGIICKLITMLSIGQAPNANIINAVINDHPKRKDFYLKAVDKATSKTAIFKEQEEVAGKLVNSVNIAQLSYQFIHPKLMSYLDEQNES
ncbi:hypothetical protein [Thalassomonas sp. M1454]|uniref:hypothetical protein n=1 Tax=Thalassomonas sp. M1454 TaxID=2594477 RepID=UPI00117CE1FA|nr:hypothetical protein [Thalassomonas sp. M1454]TRX53172.1 hypothetical protein FNN08_15015 [Thalassomonas sp. M1454]